MSTSTRKRPNSTLNLDSDSDSKPSTPSPQRSKRRFVGGASPAVAPAPAGRGKDRDGDGGRGEVMGKGGEDEDEDEDDYMNMVIPEPTTRESYSQRKKREERESELRGRPKSKQELARLEHEKREAALSTSLLESADSTHKGLKMMQRMGFVPGHGLGKKPVAAAAAAAVDAVAGAEAPRLEPVGVVFKADRRGIGHDSAQREKVAAAAAEAVAGAGGAGGMKPELTPFEYRARVAEEREERRQEGLLYAAQKVCEGFDTARDHPGEVDVVGRERTVPLRCINVLWRGMIRERETRERERRMKYDLMQSLDQPRVPGAVRECELDEEDKVALGVGVAPLRKVKGETFVEEDEEEGEGVDEELEEFEGLGSAERLKRVVEYLRGEYRYCFWCKYKYDDAEMEGCPGTEEDLHG